jgi:hypothetical protein
MNNYSIAEIRQLEQQLFDFIRRYDTSYKITINRINISSSFMKRALCKECATGPSYYYHVSKPTPWLDGSLQMRTSQWSRDWIKRMASDWFLSSQPKHFRDIKEFSFILDSKGYLPSAHNKKGIDVPYKDNVIEMLSCDCGATVWAFNEKSVKKRPEITNRKGRYKYPQRFEY